MTLNEYQALAQRTSNTTTRNDSLFNAMFGLCGEVGELADHVKKHLFQGHEFDKAHMIEEAGDVLWYLAELARALGVSLEVFAQANIQKLRIRYPSGFDAERSINRDEGAR